MVSAGLARGEWYLGALDFFFLDSRNGWIVLLVDLEDAPKPRNWGDVSSGHQRVELRKTEDGGRTWKKVPLPPALVEPYSSRLDPPISRVKFADSSNGWLMGRMTHSTHDGGRSWHRDDIPGTVEQIETGGKSAWALSILEREGHLDRKALLFESSITRSGWTPLAAQPRAGADGGALLRFDGRRAWFYWLKGVYMASEDMPDPYEGVRFTEDGGTSWAEVTSPCAAGFHGVPIPAAQILGVSGRPDVLWAVCRGDSAEGPVSLSVSQDGGRRWNVGVEQRRMRAPSSWSPSSPTRMWCAGGKMVGLEFSDDLGVTWTTPDAFSDPDVSEGIGHVQFVDSRHGWVGYSGSYPDSEAERALWIFRTEDGGRTWKGTKVVPWIGR